MPQKLPLNFRIKFEEGIDAVPQLGFDFLPRTLQDVHRYPRLMPILQRHGRVAHCRDFLRRKKPHTVHQCQIRHAHILKPAARIQCREEHRRIVFAAAASILCYRFSHIGDTKA